MARTLTADEQQRYPWASRINDYVPVGRARKLAVLATGIGAAIIIFGMGFLYVTAPDVKEGIDVWGSTIGRITLASAAVLFGLAFVVGVVTAVQAAIHSAKTPLLWSVLAMAPVLTGVAIALLT